MPRLSSERRSAILTPDGPVSQKDERAWLLLKGSGSLLNLNLNYEKRLFFLQFLCQALI